MRTVWRAKGRTVCRHGVFFKTVCECPCLKSNAERNWEHAALMPIYDADLRHLVTAKFDAMSFKRLGVLRAELRRQH
eukprot:11084824-Karenia_brevis.AAC.1